MIATLALFEIKAHLINVCNILDSLFSFQERPRPTFAALAPAVERNPVTGLLEPHFPPEKRFPRIVSGIAIIGLMVHYFFHLFFFYFVIFSGKGYTVEHKFSEDLKSRLHDQVRLFQICRQLSSIRNLQKLFPIHNCFPLPINLYNTSSLGWGFQRHPCIYNLMLTKTSFELSKFMPDSEAKWNKTTKMNH